MSSMARNAAAMPQLVCRNCLRLKPRCLPLTSASSLIRASTFFCVALCGGGRYSPLDTIWVGIGVAAEIASAPATRRCSRSLSQLPIVVLPCIAVERDRLLVAVLLYPLPKIMASHIWVNGDRGEIGRPC